MLTKPGGGGRGTHARPAEFIESNYAVTSAASFGQKLSLGGTHHVVRRVDIVRAALEGGYGRRVNWTADLVLSQVEADNLADYLIQRLEMVDAFLDTMPNAAKVVLPFFERVEPSEKTAASFILGGMGAYLAAQRWLAAGGDSIRSFLHVGTFTKGIAGKAPKIAFPAPVKKAGKKASNKVPDFLGEGQSGHWHVFESKGGHLAGRWGRLCEGLAQLAHVPPIGWTTKPAAAATTCVCVHTSVDAGQVMRVTAVDPPPVIRRTKRGGDGGARPLELIEGVCRLLKMLEALEQYRALAGNDDDEVQKAEWQFASSSSFGGLRAGVPIRYVEREEEVRYRLAVFFAIRAVLEKSTPRNFKSFLESVEKGLSSVPTEGLVGQALAFDLAAVLERLAPHTDSADFLHRCSVELGLEQLAGEVMPPPGQHLDDILLRLSQEGEYAITSGGLFLQEQPPRRSTNEAPLR